jgi:hypothetical protein
MGEGQVAVIRRWVPRSVREILYITVFWCAYTVGCLAVGGRVVTAFDNGRSVWQFERALHLPNETAIQEVLTQHLWLIRSANLYYALVHFAATGVLLLWLYRTRPAHYRWARRLLSTLTGIALVIYLVFPLAPPRMLAGTGLVDAGEAFGPEVYSDNPATDHFENQYAAMPSVHVAWATFVAVALIVAGRSRWRWLALLHPVITAVVVVGTANHYVMDAVVAWALLVGLLLVFRPPAGHENVMRVRIPRPAMEGDPCPPTAAAASRPSSATLSTFPD